MKVLLHDTLHIKPTKVSHMYDYDDQKSACMMVSQPIAELKAAWVPKVKGFDWSNEVCISMGKCEAVRNVGSAAAWAVS